MADKIFAQWIVSGSEVDLVDGDPIMIRILDPWTDIFFEGGKRSLWSHISDLLSRNEIPYTVQKFKTNKPIVLYFPDNSSILDVWRLFNNQFVVRHDSIGHAILPKNFEDLERESKARMESYKMKTITWDVGGNKVELVFSDSGAKINISMIDNDTVLSLRNQKRLAEIIVNLLCDNAVHYKDESHTEFLANRITHINCTLHLDTVSDASKVWHLFDHHEDFVLVTNDDNKERIKMKHEKWDVNGTTLFLSCNTLRHDRRPTIGVCISQLGVIVNLLNTNKIDYHVCGHMISLDGGAEVDKCIQIHDPFSIGMIRSILNSKFTPIADKKPSEIEEKVRNLYRQLIETRDNFQWVVTTHIAQGMKATCVEKLETYRHITKIMKQQFGDILVEDKD